MPKFLTIGYGERAGYDRTPLAIRNEAHNQDAKLAADGAIIGIAGSPVQVRNPEATGVKTKKGQYLASELPVAGFALIDAADIEEAVEKVSGVPCAVAHGIVEIWPIE